MQIEDDIKNVLTCKSDLSCPHEASCYRMAKFIEKLLNKPEIEIEATPDNIEHYVPNWETARP